MPNRLLLADRVGQAVASAMRQGHLVAIAYLDLDGFKAVNDTYGHEAGDQLLKEIARRVVGDVRAGDTVARIGGDEFVLVLGGLADVSQCNPVLERILNSIAQPVRVNGGVEASVSGSIGVAVAPPDGTEPRDLMAAADRAMYNAKRAGKGRIIYVSAPQQ